VLKFRQRWECTYANEAFWKVVVGTKFTRTKSFDKIHLNKINSNKLIQKIIRTKPFGQNWPAYTLAWLKSPSVDRLTVPLMPMRQCSLVRCRTAFGSWNRRFKWWPQTFSFIIFFLLKTTTLYPGGVWSHDPYLRSPRRYHNVRPLRQGNDVSFFNSTPG
jgi:hypothetical protein